MIFSSYTQDSENFTYWRLQDINFQVLLDLRRWNLSEGAYSAFPSFQLEAHSLGSLEDFLAKILQYPTHFSSRFAYEHGFYSFEFFFTFDKCFKINDFS